MADKTYKNFFDDGYTTYNSYNSSANSYSYGSNLTDNNTTSYSYMDSYDLPYVPIGYSGYYSGGRTNSKPYHPNENSFPGWILFIEWLVFGLLMIPKILQVFHASQFTQPVWFTITCCLVATWSGIQMTKRPGFSEVFVCLILSFCMCMMNIFGGPRTLLFLIVPVGIILYIYIFNSKFQVNYFGKLYNTFIFVGVVMIVNSVFFLFKWRLGCQILMLVWLVASLIILIVNIIRKIYDFIKTGQFKSLSKMKSWIFFFIGVAIPFLMRTLAFSSELVTVGWIGLGLYFIAGLILTGKNDNRKLLTYSLCFFVISVTIINLISLQGGFLENISYAFRMLDKQIGLSLTSPVADFIIRMIMRISAVFAGPVHTIAVVVITLFDRIIDLLHLRFLDHHIFPNYIFSNAFVIGPVLLVSMLGTVIGKSIRKKIQK